jgi:hypothetical protein
VSIISEAVLEVILKFNRKDWQDWIWERTHGIDFKTSLPILDDAYPYQVLQGCV